MPDWSYGLSDFLLFSPRVYYRLFELLNEALWPAQIVTLAAGLAVLLPMLRPGRTSERVPYFILGALWVWIAGAFFWDRYATINWAAVYVAPVFVLQGLLLAGFGAALARPAITRLGTRAGNSAIALFTAALIFYPSLAPLLGRSWHAAEIFGIAPDPTAIATLAALAAAPGRSRWLLMIVPAAWCAASGLTLWAMGAPEFFIPPACALAALVIAALRAG